MNDPNYNGSESSWLSVSEQLDHKTGSNLITDVTVIIRSVGERTTQVCFNLLACQVPKEHIHIVRKTPFSVALKSSFEFGIKAGRKWTLCVDADILVQSGGIAHMVQLGEEVEENVCLIQGMILDKFINCAWPTGRPGGPKFYRTALLSEAIKHIPSEGINIRPENHTLNKMRDAGYPWRSYEFIFGLHDYEQFYRDIFRKCYVHAHKHDFLIPKLLGYWRQQAITDPDFRFALWGLAAGMGTVDGVRIDIQKTPFDILDFFAGVNWSEKAPLESEEWGRGRVDIIIDDYFREIDIQREKELTSVDTPSIFSRFENVYRRVGMLKLIPYLGGALFYKSGKQIVQRLG